ncbi:Amun [Drosophila busckii]|uniref:Amun n=1 Tax=Drosophila busckii TaxID=30019 RepID=A0A0M4EV10_DROBS|nr:uncharacterized protein LOC108605208 [Drosophila busckii]XP_017850301.1 uncharacterized protein LOC108605208 [Drosophila busckii]XP_017850302.1 uncharacterized protein LOC108605208 [Drosophila busckii]XP_017850303.1 uncharacterized protein LOC108605208 [Drosophila busckii]ALC49022.1 Amun [Drosophila busckii]
MSNGKATASFFENGSTSQFEYCYKLYPQVLKMKAEKRSKKPQELIRLDQWYQNELPNLIKARGKDAHLVYDELVQTMKWKQSRGKFYPQLSYLVKVNTPRAVMQETKKAFRKLPNLEQAITALSNLKGVGTTMASALLTAAAPDSAPFMADECLMAIPEIEGIDYTTKEYLNFVQHIQSTVERLNAEVGGDTPHWSPHRVELALWAHYVANDLSPELLDDMPPPGTAINTNGSLSKSTSNSKELDGEDTNDGVGVDVDDESLGAGGGRNTATESETENENTNPIALTPLSASDAVKNNSNTAALQDGDSNFVSNDSTSQEPIIDDNTTQTTATTSTEDGEPLGGGTPLASDSESNLEAPLKTTGNRLPATAAAAAAVAASAGTQATPHNGQSAAQSTATEVVPVAIGVGAAAANGNGNGTAGNGILGLTNAIVAEDEDDEEGDDEDEDDDEDEELEADESNSSSSNLRASNKLQHLSEGTTAEAMLTAPSIGQKRSALHCDMETSANSAVGDKSPDLKKMRSD